MNIQMIALNNLVPSTANVRKTGATFGIEELAASIAAHGLLQNLQVLPTAKGKFEVVAGGRRLAALKLLVKYKRMDKDAEIPCHVLSDEDAGEISLAENVQREPMHPADQFEAFHALIERGRGVEEIAARFGVSVAVVRQRLKLATVSPRLIQLYREDELSLDQLMAFTVTDDTEAQERVWAEAPTWGRDPSAIRRTLTATQVEADDRRALFVGLEAYKAAGGSIAHDLFQPEHDGYLLDVALLDRLVSEKLQHAAEPVKAEGWRWVEVVAHFDHNERQGFKHIAPTTGPLPDEAQAELSRLQAEYDGLIEEHGDEPEQEICDQLDALSEQIDALTRQAETWSVTDKALAGVVIALERNGTLLVERGLVRAEDAKLVFAAREGEQNLGPVRPANPLSARLVEDLTAERTAAIRAVMMDNNKVTLAALAHALALPLFYGRGMHDESCLDITLTSRNLAKSGQAVETGEAMQRIEKRLQDWQSFLPDDQGDLLGWLLVQTDRTVTSLLTFCTAQSIDAVRVKSDRADCPRLVHADALAEALSLDMAQWWEADATRYLARVPKALVLEAIAEGVSSNAAHGYDTVKKDVLVRDAEKRLKGKRWLPSLLRSTSSSAQEDDPALIAAE
jgi:ParB family chromosome partitioning protein